jgi:hypothetical protein
MYSMSPPAVDAAVEPVAVGDGGTTVLVSLDAGAVATAAPPLDAAMAPVAPPEKPAPDKVVPEKPVPEKQAPEKVVPKKPAPEKPAPEKVVPGKPAPEKVVPEPALPEKPIRPAPIKPPVDRPTGPKAKPGERIDLGADVPVPPAHKPPEPEVTRPVEKAKPETVGYLTAYATPFAQVSVDGQPTGKSTPITPMGKIALPPGIHKVTFVVGRQTFTYSVKIELGKTAKISRDLPVSGADAP